MRNTGTSHQAAPPHNPGREGHHTCTRCPVCGMEECAVLQDLGMACNTAQAATDTGIRRKAAIEPQTGVRKAVTASRR